MIIVGALVLLVVVTLYKRRVREKRKFQTILDLSGGELPTTVVYNNAVFNPHVDLEQDEPDMIDSRALPSQAEESSEA